MSNESPALEYHIGTPRQEIIINLLVYAGIPADARFLHAPGVSTTPLENIYIVRADGKKIPVYHPGAFVQVYPGDMLCNGDKRVLLT